MINTNNRVTQGAARSFLPEAYHRVLAEVTRFVSHNRGLAVGCYGSVSAADVSVAVDPVVLLSDVDLMFVASDVDLLRKAARFICWLNRLVAIPNAPLFKVGAKFRLVAELSLANISANELSAISDGHWLNDPKPHVPVRVPMKWYVNQARLGVMTRLAYDQCLINSEMIEASPISVAYISAKTILEFARCYLLSRGYLVTRYDDRVRVCLSILGRCVEHSVFLECERSMRRALEFRLSPSLERAIPYLTAQRFIIESATRHNLIDPAAIRGDLYARTWGQRKLDIRDRVWLSGKRTLRSPGLHEQR